MKIYALSLPSKKDLIWKNLANMDKVMKALEWLKQNNHVYSDVKISQEAADKITRNSHKFLELVEEKTEKANDETDETATTKATENNIVEVEDEEVPKLKRMLTETFDPQITDQYSLKETEDCRVANGEHLKTFIQEKVEGQPLYHRTTDNLDVMVHPTIYPTGLGGLNMKRIHKLRPVDFYRYRLESSDPRYRRDLRYLHTGYLRKRENQMSSALYAQTKTGSHITHMNKGQLLAKMQNGDKNIENDLTTAFASLKGTKEYWSRKGSDLRAMCETFGPITFFVTLSCAEYKWNDLHDYIREKNSDVKGIEKMTPDELIQLDRVTVSEFFMRRFNSLMTNVILNHYNGENHEGPLGLVKEYFYRVEYQARGAPHIHMALWTENAPILGENSNQEVLDFISKYITAKVPDDNLHLKALVEEFQMHKCTGSCLRSYCKKTGRWRNTTGKRCRYGFPKDTSEHYELNDFNESVKSRRNSKKKVKNMYNLPRKENERTVNPYNPALLSEWQANMDIQYIGEHSYVLNQYVTSYMTKAEKNQTKDMWELMNQNKSQASQIMTILNARFRDREVGTYEIADDLLGHPLHGCSSIIKYLDVNLPGKRSRALKTKKELEKLDDDSTEILKTNLIETYYPKRSVELENESLYSIVQNYNFKHGDKPENDKPDPADYVPNLEKEKEDDSDDEEKDEDDSKGKKYYCLDGKGYFTKRKKLTVVKTRYISNNPQNEELFYHALLMMFVPYRDEESLKLDQTTWKAAFEEHIKQPEYEFLLEKKEWKLKWQKGTELKTTLEEEATAEENSEEVEPWQFNEAENDYSPEACVNAGFREKSDYKTSEGLQKRVDMLNKKQKEIYEDIMKTLEHQLKHDKKECTCSNVNQIRKFISGGAGVGKSKLIETITEGIETLTNQDVLLAAPTGLAAANISGKTIHSLFSIKCQSTANKWLYERLRAEQEKELFNTFKQAKMIIIDEISMVSNRLLAFMNSRLNDIFNKPSDCLFGGRNIIVLGDLLQLPPVGNKNMNTPFPFIRLKGANFKEAFPSSPLTQYPVDIWKSFKYDELTENMRQKSDFKYAEMLNSLRLGLPEQTNPDDIIKELNAKVIQLDKPSITEKSKKMKEIKDKLGYYPVCILPKRQQVLEMNIAMLTTEKIKPVFLHASSSESRNSIQCRPKQRNGKFKPIPTESDPKQILDYIGKSNDEEIGGMKKIEIIGINARVMLRKNLDVEKGLYNGALGTVKNIIYNNQSPDKISAIEVLFDNVPKQLIKIERAEVSQVNKSARVMKRYQFPLTLAYAITIHKSQGLSLDAVIADLGDDVFSCGMSYVALSRVRSIDGLYLFNLNPERIHCSHLAVDEYNRLRKLYTNLEQLKAGSTKPPDDKQRKNTVKRTIKDANIALNVNEAKSNDEPKEKKPKLTDSKYGNKGDQKIRFKNPDNRCFMNSAIQAILPSDELEACINAEPSSMLKNELKGFYKAQHNMTEPTVKDSKKVRDLVTTEAQKQIKLLADSQAAEIFMNSDAFEEIEEVEEWKQTAMENVNFSNGEHHSSMEFMRNMIPLDQSIRKCFQFEYIQEIKCKSCGLITENQPTTSTDISLKLDQSMINQEVTIEDLIQDLSTIEKHCELCNQNQEHEKWMTVKPLRDTKIILLEFQQFIQFIDNDGDPITEQVSINYSKINPDDIEIDGKQFIIISLVLYHPFQNDFKKGHYTAISRSKENTWIYHDDEQKPRIIEGITDEHMKKVAYFIIKPKPQARVITTDIL